MGIAAVNWLTLLESCKRPRGGGRLDLEYWIGQVLVKPAGFDDSDRFQIVLEQQIIIVGMRRSKGWIAYCHPVAPLLHRLERRQIGEVRTRNAPSISRQDIRVGLRPWRWRIRGKRSIRIEFCNGS